MKQFADLLLDLENTTKTLSKVSYLKRYFNSAETPDRVWAIALFTHRRPKRQVNTRLLAEWAIEKAKLDHWLFEESYSIVGDLAETLSLITPEPKKENDLSLSFWVDYLMNLDGCEEQEKKIKILEAWDQLSKQEKLVFNKLITGGFRVGVSKNLVIRALAEATNQEQTEIAHRLMGDWDPASVSFEKLILESDENENLSRPYPFYLAYPLEDDASNLGSHNEWFAEWKWDGIRSQTVKRGGKFFLWSRGEDLITDKFPELHPLEKLLPNGTVIDGELLPFKNDHPLPFALLQTRIGRKNVTKKHLQDAPAKIYAYDLLEYNGEDIRDRPLIERRKLLESVIDKHEFNDWIQFSPLVEVDTWEELKKLRLESRANFAEGFMLKRKDSPYQVGRKRGDWWKWKVDPLSVDAVMLYAQRGHGRRADLYSDCTFAVWDGGTLVPFAKAYSGLTDKEIVEVTRFVKANTLERFGPVRTVQPTQVFEIHFEGIAESKRHKSGVSVRFPRISRWRKDKKPEEANTLDDLKSMLSFQSK